MSAPAPASDVPGSAGGAAAVARLRAAGKEMRATLAQTAMSAWADDTDELAKKGRGAAAASGTDGAGPELPDASLDTAPGGRPPASSHFWLESVQVSGALLMHSRTSELQKEHLLESLRLWNAHRLPDAADPEADTGASAPPVGAIKKGLRERTEKLGTLHTEMITRAREESRTATRKAQEMDEEAQRWRQTVLDDRERADGDARQRVLLEKERDAAFASQALELEALRRKVGHAEAQVGQLQEELVRMEKEASERASERGPP